jgi:hypothetical protein
MPVILRIVFLVSFGLVAGIAASAAATAQRRVPHTRPAAAGTNTDNVITSECRPTDNPCRTRADGW